MIRKITALIFATLIGFSFTSAAHAQHYVTKGDTMGKIAKEHKMSLKDLISLNPHIKNPNILHINDYIIIRSGTETQQDMVDYAKSLQSVTAYSYGGNNFPYQTDCSGFVQGVLKKFGKTIPRVSRDQAIDPKAKPVKFQDLQIGDLMFFSNRADKVISHVGIYMGNDYWISNLNSAKDVEILSSWGKWSRENFMWGTRYEL